MKTKRIPIYVRLGLLIAILIAMSTAMVSAENKQQGMDVVLVIDTSGSMKESDKDRIAIEAAKLFIDMMETKDSRVGVIGFSDKITAEIPMTSIETPEDKDDIKKAIDQLVYADDTDIGLAMTKGADLIKDLDSNRMILLFTDGKIDFTGDDQLRTKEQSEKDVWKIAGEASGKFPIYTIGLNSDSSVDEELIQGIADQTEAKSYMVDSAINLPDIFNEIFADFINSNIINLGTVETNGIDYSEIPVTIPNESIMEANIIMLSSDLLEDITITNPDGAAEAIDNVKVIMSQSSKYSMLKLIKPKQGEWLIRIKGVEGCKVHVNLLFNYDISLIMEIDGSKEYLPGEQVSVLGYLETDGNRITEEYLYSEFIPTLIIEAKDGNMIEASIVTQDNQFIGLFTSKAGGEVKISLRIDSESFYRVTDPVTITFAEAAVIEPTVAADQAPVINPKSPAIKASSILPIILIVIAVIVLIAGIILLLKKMKAGKAPFEGRIYYNVDAPGYRGERRRYELLYQKGSIKLNSVLQDSNLAPSELGKIVLYPDFVEGPCIKIINKSKYKMVSGYGMDAVSIAHLGRDESVEISCQNNNDIVSIHLEYEY